MYKRKLKTRILFLTFFLIVILPLPVFAGRYVVSSTASSTNWSAASWTNYPSAFSGTACIPATAMANAVAGDTVYFRGGQGGNYSVPGGYYEMPVWNPSRSGTAGNPITFTNYPNETPIIINTTQYSSDPIMGSNGYSYITIDGFQFGTGASNEGIAALRFQSANNWIVKNCVWKCVNLGSYNWGPNTQAIYSDGAAGGTMYNALIQNCLFTGGQSAIDQHFNFINIYFTNQLTIEYCTFELGWGGVNLKNGGVDFTVRYNFFRNIQDYGYGSLKLGGQGGPWSNVNIYQNVFIQAAGTNAAICPWGSGSGLHIYNNTIYGVASGMYADSESPTITNLDIYNNVAQTPTYTAVFQTRTTLAYMDYNIFYGAQSWTYQGSNSASLAAWKARGWDTHSYYENPVFANAGGSLPSNYKISAAHKNSGRGGAYSSVIGAYITGNEQIGYVNPSGSPPPPPPDPPPSPPAGFRIQ